MIGKWLCKLVGHRFGEWTYVAADSCEQTRTCARDGVRESRVGSHSFTTWAYVAEGDCDQVRTCSRCRLAEKRVNHAWETDPDNAEMGEYCWRRACPRDGAVEEQRHEWVNQGTATETSRTDYQGEVEWHYVVDVTRYRCANCGRETSGTSGEGGWVESYKL